MSSVGFSFIKTLVLKLLDRETLREIFEYVISEYRVDQDTNSFINFIYYILSDIKSNFLNKEKNNISEWRKIIRKNRDFIPDSFLEIENNFSEIIDIIRKKEDAINILIKLIETRNTIVENWKNEGLIDESEEVLELPKTIFEDISFDETDLNIFFGLSYSDIKVLVSRPFTKEKLDELKRNIRITLDKWRYVFGISDLYEKVEEFKIKFETSKYETVSEFVKEFEEFVLSLKIIFAELEKDLKETGNSKVKKLKRSGFLIVDDETSDQIISEFISEQYTVYKTGKVFIDGRINGFEAGQLYLYAAPPNHGKSLLMLNTVKWIIENNLHQFDENDGILFVTLEDNKLSLTRRILTVFGNYNFFQINDFYSSLNALISYAKEFRPELYKKTVSDVKKILSELRKKSINNITKGKIHFVVRDASNSKDKYSVIDLIKDIETLKTEFGINIKIVVIDYLNEMRSTKHYSDTYKEHGEISRELRKFANAYMIPVITATQLRREYEEPDKELSTTAMGDSVEKNRTANYIIMFRRTDKFTTNIDSDSGADDGKKKKRKTRNILTSEKYLNYTEVNSRLIDSNLISKKLTEIMVENDIPYFSIPRYQKWLEKIKKSVENSNFTILSEDNDMDEELFKDTEEDEFEIMFGGNNDENEIDTKDNPNSQTSAPIHPFVTKPDSFVYTEIVTPVEYKITKAKDMLASISSVYEYLTKYVEVNEENKKIANLENQSVKFRNFEMNVRDLIYEFGNSYILFSKYNYQYYDLVDLQKIENDLFDGFNKFVELHKLLTDENRLPILKYFKQDYEKVK